MYDKTTGLAIIIENEEQFATFRYLILKLPNNVLTISWLSLDFTSASGVSVILGVCFACWLIFPPKNDLNKKFERRILNMFFEETGNGRVLNVECVEQQKEFMTISASNVPRLLDLISSLQCRISRHMQISINNYLSEVTSAGLVFLLCPLKLTSDYVIECIGNAEVQPPVYIKDDWSALNVLFENEELHHAAFKASCMDIRLVDMVSQKLFERTAETFRNFVITPCFLPDKEQPQLFVVLVNTAATDKDLEKDITLVGECSRYCLPTLRNTMIAEEMRERHEKLKVIMSEVHVVADELGDDQLLITRIKKAMERILKCEASAIFLKEDKFLVSNTQDYGRPLDMDNELLLKNVKIPLGVGLTGLVGAMGQVIVLNDPKKEPMHCNVPAFQSRYKNVLGFPFIFKDLVFGVGEVYNKIIGSFTESDKVYAEVIGQLFGPFLKQGLRLRRVCDGSKKREVVAALLGNKLKRFPQDEPEENRIKDAYKKFSLEEFKEPSFLPSSVSDENSIVCIMAAFDQLGFIGKFQIQVEPLIRFLLYQRKDQQRFPFRNWFHSFCSFQFLYSLIQNYKLMEDNSLSEILALSMLLATLCNGCGYGGATHRFQLETGPVLASVYTSPGRRNEMYAVQKSIEIMINPDFNFMLRVTPSCYREFIETFDAMVLATDLADYSSNMQAFDAVDKHSDATTEEEQSSSKSRFCQLLMVCSKISDHARIWEHALETGNRLFKEYHRTKQPTCSTRIFVIPEIDSLPMRAKLQSHFITSMCIPVFKALQKLYPETEDYLLNMETNLKKLDVLYKQLKKQEIAETGGEGGSSVSVDAAEEYTN